MNVKDDPIVEEIRTIRQRHAERFNFDLNAIVADIQRQEKESKHVFTKRPPRKAVVWERRKADSNKKP